MHQCTAVIERCAESNLYLGHVPGLPGAHSQGATLGALHANLVEVLQRLLEDGEADLSSEFIGTQTIAV